MSLSAAGGLSGRAVGRTLYLANRCVLVGVSADMARVRNLVTRRGVGFGYDAIVDNALRSQPCDTLRSEDQELTPSARRRLVARSRDIRRNFSIARFAIGKHLDFVSSFRFRPFTGDREFDRRLERFIDDKSRPEACDASGRFSLRRMVRLAEALRTVDGDVLWLRLADGRSQLIEGDRIRDPQRDTLEGWVHGVRVTSGGRPLAFAVYSRSRFGGFVLERVVPAEHAYHHGYWDRYDQVRGVSPLASALNCYRDVYDNFNYAMIRAKASQLYGLVIKREAGADRGYDDLPPEGEDEGDSASEDPGAFTIDPNGGPVAIDLKTGEDASILESKTPSNEFQSFNDSMTAVALKALDLPYSFYREDWTNFFGSRAALQLYLKACESKRADNQELLDNWTRWRIGLGIEDGELDPTRYGIDPDDIYWSWTPSGIPWWDARDVNADMLAVHSGFRTRSSVIEERTGGTFEDVADRLAEEEEYLKELGLSVQAPANPMPIGPEPSDRPSQGN